MNEFVMDASTKLTPDEIVWCVMGTRTDQLVMDILENRGGKYDALYTSHQKRNPSITVRLKQFNKKTKSDAKKKASDFAYDRLKCPDHPCRTVWVF